MASSSWKPRKFEHESIGLGKIHAASNYRKALGYWLGFLKGVMASENVVHAEIGPLRAEAGQFLSLLHDDDAAELIQDLDIWANDMKEVYGILENIVEMRSHEFVVESERDAVNEFYGFCAGIACDNSISPTEVEKLLSRLDCNPELSKDSRVASLGRSARLSIADGRITPDEAEDICGWITRLVGDSATDTGLPTFGNVGVIDGSLEDVSKVVVSDRVFVLTGKFVIAPRKAIAGKIVEQGGMLNDIVSSRTDYLAIAAESSRDWKFSHAGTKIVKAMELRERGNRPELVLEPMLARALGI